MKRRNGFWCLKKVGMVVLAGGAEKTCKLLTYSWIWIFFSFTPSSGCWPFVTPFLLHACLRSLKGFPRPGKSRIPWQATQPMGMQKIQTQLRD